MRQFIKQLVPFLLIGVAIVAFAFGIMLLAYLFLLGAIVGLTLFMIAWIKDKFSRKKKLPQKRPPSGRVIDSDEWKKM